MNNFALHCLLVIIFTFERCQLVTRTAFLLVISFKIELGRILKYKCDIARIPIKRFILSKWL